MRWRRHKLGFYARTCVSPAAWGSLWRRQRETTSAQDKENWRIRLKKNKTLPPTVNVHVAVGAVQVALLRHDDVLDVFHGEMVAEGVVEQPLQLVHRQFLHVALTQRRRKKGSL